MKAKILVVDDEENVRQSLEHILRLEGYETTSASYGDQALDELARENYDLMLLDLRLPGMDGIEVMRRAVQVNPQTKIILLTGHGSLESAIEALRRGAHDYILKPAITRDLLSSVSRALTLKIEQQQRRLLLEQLDTSVQRLKIAEGIELSSQPDQEIIHIDNEITVDLARREIWGGDTRVSMTPTEGKLVKVMLENRGRVLSHRELVLLVQGYEATDWEAPEVLRPLISRLRRKLAAFPGGDKWIANVRGTGYVFEPKVGKEAAG
jgi:DNA-binding response OmpR family regulator